MLESPQAAHPTVEAAGSRPAPPYAAILCAVDLSDVDESSSALAHALAEAGGVVHLLHVTPPVETTRQANGAVSSLDGSADARDRLARLRPVDAGSRRVRTEVHVVEGDPVEAITKFVGDHPVDAIVVGTHGRSGFGHVLMGTVADAVARRSNTPVLLLYPGRRAKERGRPWVLRSILCATDLSTRGNGAVPVAYALSTRSATVHLLHVWQRPFCPSDDSPEERRRRRRDACRGLVDAAKPGADGKAWTELHVVEDDDPSGTITRYASSLPADLVVLGTRGGTRGRTGLLGAISSEAIRGPTPVLLVRRPPEPA